MISRAQETATPCKEEGHPDHDALCRINRNAVMSHPVIFTQWWDTMGYYDRLDARNRMIELGRLLEKIRNRIAGESVRA